jgi:hypothetical protein
MFQGFEALDRLADLFLTDANGGGCDTCCHSVILIVNAFEGKIINTHLKFFTSGIDIHLAVPDKSSFVGFLLHSKW